MSPWRMSESRPWIEFEKHCSTSPFEVPSQIYLSYHPDSKFKYLATGALVFDSSQSEIRGFFSFNARRTTARQIAGKSQEELATTKMRASYMR